MIETVWMASVRNLTNEVTEALGIYASLDSARRGVESQASAANPSWTTEPDWAYFVDDEDDPDEGGYYAWQQGYRMWEIAEYEVLQ